jgi:hypothetical protein
MPANALPGDLLVRLGDSAYAHKLYDSAAYYYGQASNGFNPDAVVLYKLGNAHYRLAQNGEAVLAYERALQHSPGFSAAAENIALIQQRIQPDAGRDDVFFIRWWRQLTKPSFSNAWAIFGAFCFCFPIGVLIWSRFRRTWPSWLWPHGIIGGIALSLLFTVLSAVAVTRSSRDTGVIMKQDASFSTGSKTGGKQQTITLPEGLLIKVLDNEGSGLRVELPDGREGLVQHSDIAIVK